MFLVPENLFVSRQVRATISRSWTLGRFGTKALSRRVRRKRHHLDYSVLVEKTEAASGLIYWDSRQFRWHQQGD